MNKNLKVLELQKQNFNDRNINIKALKYALVFRLKTKPVNMLSLSHSVSSMI